MKTTGIRANLRRAFHLAQVIDPRTWNPVNSTAVTQFRLFCGISPPFFVLVEIFDTYHICDQENEVKTWMNNYVIRFEMDVITYRDSIPVIKGFVLSSNMTMYKTKSQSVTISRLSGLSPSFVNHCPPSASGDKGRIFPHVSATISVNWNMGSPVLY